MAACGSLQHIFEKPLPESPTLFDSLSSWKHIKTMKTLDHVHEHDHDHVDHSSSFTEIFGELHFKEKRQLPDTALSSPLPETSSPTSPASSVMTEPSLPATMEKLSDERGDKSPTRNYFPTTTTQTRHYRHSDSFSSMNSESLSLCTEGLGFESFDDVEDLKNNITSEWQHHHHHRRRASCSSTTAKHSHTDYLCGEPKRSRISGVEFPPPISCIGRSGKPWVCFKSYRNNGRFILKEVRIPTQEFLHACREDGRLKLQFIQSDDEIIEEEDEDEDDVEEDEEGEGDGEEERERETEEKSDDEHHAGRDSEKTDDDEEENGAEKDDITGQSP